MLELKDKLDLLFKFLFLVIFTYAVVTFTCCKQSCKTQCNTTNFSKCCNKSNVPIKQCCPNCSKPCCAK